MKKIAILAILVIAFSIPVFAEGDPPPCTDGHTPVGIACRIQTAPINSDTEIKPENSDDIFSIISNWLRTIF